VVRPYQWVDVLNVPRSSLTRGDAVDIGFIQRKDSCDEMGQAIVYPKTSGDELAQPCAA
jgi:hypothetical protein